VPPQISPALAAQPVYPFVRLDDARREREAAGERVLDFGKGDPYEPTDPAIREAIGANLRERMGYPLAVGLPELRESIAAWCRRRFAVEVDPERELVPTYGSKEAIFSLALVLAGPGSERRLVLHGEPAYPVYGRAAELAGAEVRTLPLLEENGFLPDLDAVPAETWRRCAILWLNYPHNPTGAVAPLSFYERVAALAREHGFAVGSDEAYTELWFDEPPASALQVGDRGNVIVFNTLSKRSSMTGYRSGFMVAAPETITALRSFRATAGTAPQEFVQRASIVAWNDEAHVERTRAAYARKRELLLPVLARKGLRVVASTATMYLWVAVEEPAEQLAARLLEHGVLITPGTFFGPSGEGYVRIALVPTEEECRAAAGILEEAL
jgi:N-succinyldiaminopimelate aminotransferase